MIALTIDAAAMRIAIETTYGLSFSGLRAPALAGCRDLGRGARKRAAYHAVPTETASAKATTEMREAEPYRPAIHAMLTPPTHAAMEPPAAITPNNRFAWRGSKA